MKTLIDQLDILPRLFVLLESVIEIVSVFGPDRACGVGAWFWRRASLPIWSVHQDTRQPATDQGSGRDGISNIGTDSDRGCWIGGLYPGPQAAPYGATVLVKVYSSQ